MEVDQPFPRLLPTHSYTPHSCGKEMSFLQFITGVIWATHSVPKGALVGSSVNTQALEDLWDVGGACCGLR
jgi:hypothetical protein